MRLGLMVAASTAFLVSSCDEPSATELAAEQVAEEQAAAEQIAADAAAVPPPVATAAGTTPVEEDIPPEEEHLDAMMAQRAAQEALPVIIEQCGRGQMFQPPGGGPGCQDVEVFCARDLEVSGADRRNGVTSKTRVGISYVRYTPNGWEDRRQVVVANGNAQGQWRIDPAPGATDC